MRRRDLMIFVGALPFGGAAAVSLAEARSDTLEQFAQLESVNTRINAIPYVADDPRFGEPFDTWKSTPDGKSWPCRDYVVAKAAVLRDLGWPREVDTRQPLDNDLPLGSSSVRLSLGITPGTRDGDVPRCERRK